MRTRSSSAGEGARQLAAALFQPGKVAVDPLHVLRHTLGIRNGIGAHFQVFLHGHLGKHMTALRHMGQPQPDDGVGGDRLEVRAVQRDGAGGGAQQSEDGMQRGGLARAVGADQGHQLAVAYRQGDTLESVDRAVKYMQIFDFQHMCSLPYSPR